MLLRWLSLCAALACLSSAAVAFATPTDGLLDPCAPATVVGAESELFKDMPPGSAGHQEAQLLHAEGITTGCQTSPLLYCPSCEISRVAMVVLLVRAAELPLINPSQPTFADVAPGSSFYQEVETAAASGITLGCGGGNFCPSDPVPRGAAAVFVMRAAELTPQNPAVPAFSDVPATHPEFAAIEALKKYCVTTGCTGTQYCPEREATRAEAAVFVARAFDLADINPCLGASDAGADSGAADAATDGAGAGGGWSDSGPAGDAATGGGGGSSGGDRGGTSEASGCGCKLASSPQRGASLALAAAMLLFVRRTRSPC